MRFRMVCCIPGSNICAAKYGLGFRMSPSAYSAKDNDFLFLLFFSIAYKVTRGRMSLSFIAGAYRVQTTSTVYPKRILKNVIRVLNFTDPPFAPEGYTC